MTSKTTRVFFVGLAFGLVGSIAGAAGAWNRTVAASNGFLPPSEQAVTIPFPSDGVSGTPNGNTTTAVYADFYIVGLASGQTQSVRMIACGQAYNAAVLLCGAPVINTYTANGTYDVNVPRWSGTGSPWDYFTVSITNWGGAGTVYATGIGAVGT